MVATAQTIDGTDDLVVPLPLPNAIVYCYRVQFFDGIRFLGSTSIYAESDLMAALLLPTDSIPEEATTLVIERAVQQRQRAQRKEPE